MVRRRCLRQPASDHPAYTERCPSSIPSLALGDPNGSRSPSLGSFINGFCSEAMQKAEAFPISLPGCLRRRRLLRRVDLGAGPSIQQGPFFCLVAGGTRLVTCQWPNGSGNEARLRPLSSGWRWRRCQWRRRGWSPWAGRPPLSRSAHLCRAALHRGRSSFRSKAARVFG